MIALVPLLVLSGVTLVEQPIDGLETGYTGHWSTKEDTSTRYVDLDGDGANDIVTPTSAAFQRDGGFPKAQQTPLPRFDNPAYLDAWANEIYVLMRNRIEVLRWSKSEWQATLSQPIEWGDAVKSTYFRSDNSTAPPSLPRFEHFLCNLDDDPSPEILRVASDGVHVYAKKDLFYAEAAVWHVLPPLNAIASPAPLWPPEARKLEVPELHSRADVRVWKMGIWIVTPAPADESRLIYRRDIYALDDLHDLALPDTPSKRIDSEPVDAEYLYTTLNTDDIIDFIGSSLAGQTEPPLSMPIFDECVSTDGGKTFFTVKSIGSEPRRWVADYNKDERIDLVTENKRLVEGGIRETLLRGLTRSEVDLEVGVWLQDESGGFPAKPTFSQIFTISLDKPPAYQSSMFRNLLAGRLFSIDGDFDGDGFGDAVIHDKPGRITVRRGGPKGITSDVLATIPTQARSEFGVSDVDGDGRSDLVVSNVSPGGERTETGATLYLSRDAAP